MNSFTRSCILAVALTFVSATAIGGVSINLTQLTAPGVLDNRWALTADGQRAVFVAHNSGAEEVYSVRLDQPGQIVRLSRNAEDNGAAEILKFDVSQDSLHVVYLVRLPGVTSNSLQLSTVPVDASSTPGTLSTVDEGTTMNGGITFAISPASDRVVYVETTEAMFPFTESVLNSQLISGGGSSVLHPATLSITFEISPNGSQVVFSALSLEEPAKLFSIPIAGGSSVQLNDDNDLPGEFRIGPNSQRVVFAAVDQESAAQSLQSTPIGGGGRTTLATPSENAAIGIFAVNGDTGSPRAVFVEGRDPGQSRLASVLIAGGGEGDLTNGFIDGGIGLFLFSPDGQWVVFQVIESQATEGTGDPFTAELHSAPVAGLSQGGTPSTFFKGSANDAGFTFIPSFDSNRLLYGAVAADDQAQAGDYPGTTELLSAGIEGGAAETLAGPLPGGMRVSFFFPFFDSQNVFYLADREQDDVQELFTVPIAGGDSTKVNGPLPTGGDVTSAFATPDSGYLVYDADQESDGLFDLYLVPVGEEAAEVIFCSLFNETVFNGLCRPESTP